MPDSQPQPPHSSSSSGRARSRRLLLSGARLADGRTVDVRLHGDRIEAVGTAGSLTPMRPLTPLPTPLPDSASSTPSALASASSASSATGPGRAPAPGSASASPGGANGPASPPGARLDLTGYLLLPAPAEPHAHADTALTADLPGPVSDDPEDIERRVTEAALIHLGHGATAQRAHVRVGELPGLGALSAVLRARRALRGLARLTAVAMPRVLTGVAGADGLAMLRDAVSMGADVVGGCPDLDPDPAGYVEAVLEVAAEYGCPVDLHTDAADPARLARLAAMAGGLRPGVALGPCDGLGRLPAEVAARAADQLAAAGVTVVCLPQGPCVQGCGGGTDHRDGTAPVRLLRAAGVRITAGSGALRDVANPVGRGDPLEAAYLLASRQGLRPDEAYGAVSGAARAMLGLPEVRVEAGFPAELLAVRGDSLAGALSLSYSRIVVHRGQVVARTSAVREYGDPTPPAELDLPRQDRGRRRGGGSGGTA